MKFAHSILSLLPLPLADGRGFTNYPSNVSVADGDNAGYFNGSLDEVRLFDSALSASDVQKIYQQETPFGSNQNINI